MFQKTGEKQEADKDSERAFFLAKMVFSKDEEIREGKEFCGWKNARTNI